MSERSDDLTRNGELLKFLALKLEDLTFLFKYKFIDKSHFLGPTYLSEVVLKEKPLFGRRMRHIYKK